MAAVTGGCGADVIAGFTRGTTAVMTGGTTTCCYTIVVHGGGCPARGFVAAVA